MSLGYHEGTRNVSEIKGEYGEFNVIVGTVVNEANIEDYIIFADKQKRVPDLEFSVIISRILRVGTNLNNRIERERTIDIEPYLRKWKHRGYYVKDLDGLVNAANGLLQKLRQKEDYPHRRYLALLKR